MADTISFFEHGCYCITLAFMFYLMLMTTKGRTEKPHIGIWLKADYLVKVVALHNVPFIVNDTVTFYFNVWGNHHHIVF